MTQVLKGKVALVTGASSGIGKSAAIALAQAGASVVLGARRQEEGEAVAQYIRDQGGNAIFQQTDVNDPKQQQALVDRAVSEFGGLDIAFNNAGLDGKPGSLIDEEESNFDAVLNTNVKGVWHGIRAQVPALRARGGGSIINTSSILGINAIAYFGSYVASKFAVEGLTKSAALEFAKENIRVNTIAPGPIQTPMFERASGGNPDAFSSMIAMGRSGTTDEIAPAVVFLASDQSGYITGNTLAIGGGATAGFVTN